MERESAVRGTFWDGLGRTVVDSGAPPPQPAASPRATDTDHFAAEGVTSSPHPSPKPLKTEKKVKKNEFVFHLSRASKN